MAEQFDKDDPNRLITEKYDTQDAFYDSIPEEGSLGILALGAYGLMLWRKKRIELKKARENNG